MMVGDAIKDIIYVIISTGIDPDELLDSGFTDANGMFELKGTERELTTIDPVFKIYHDCNDGNTV